MAKFSNKVNTTIGYTMGIIIMVCITALIVAGTIKLIGWMF